jgi:hypothetical protein
MSYIPLSRADLASATPYVVDADHTTAGTEILKCVADAVVVLNLSPKDRETVLVHLSTSNTIQIVGDIHIYNSYYYNIAEYNEAEYGGTTLTLNTKDTTVHLMYVRSFGEWIAI